MEAIPLAIPQPEPPRHDPMSRKHGPADDGNGQSNRARRRRARLYSEYVAQAREDGRQVTRRAPTAHRSFWVASCTTRAADVKHDQVGQWPASRLLHRGCVSVTSARRGRLNATVGDVGVWTVKLRRGRWSCDLPCDWYLPAH